MVLREEELHIGVGRAEIDFGQHVVGMMGYGITTQRAREQASSLFTTNPRVLCRPL